MIGTDSMAQLNAIDMCDPEDVSEIREEGCRQMSLVVSRLEEGIHPDRPHRNGRTSLTVAARHATDSNYHDIHDWFEIVEYLIEAGANVNMSDEYGRTPLMEAVNNYSGNSFEVRVIEALLKAGADPMQASNLHH